MREVLSRIQQRNPSFLAGGGIPRPAVSFRTALLLGWLALCLPGPLASASAQQARHSAPSAWEHSVVTLEIGLKQYDYYQPWTRKTARLQKPGLVVGEGQILTTAEELFNRTLVRVQKHGRGKWWTGEVTWIDYYANLALLTVREPDFWKDLKPAVLNGAMPAESTLQILRWRAGNLENRHAEFTQFTVREGQLAQVNHVVLEADSDIQGAGWGEPLVANSHVVGLVSSQDGRTCTAIPATFIQSILEARKKGQYHGLGFFHFYWEPAQNPASLARLKLPGEARGVIVIDVPKRPDTFPAVLKPEDIILRIDGFDLDIQGDYEDPEYGHLMLENLSTRSKWAGDEVKLQIWREGKLMDVAYRLPKFQYSNSLVPMAEYDRDPDYFIVGGLVFQPLTDSYLQSWGTDWKSRAPFRLMYYRGEPSTAKRPGLVLLSQILPDPYNIGYQEQKFLVLDKVNGQSVSRLTDLRDALTHPENGYHIFDFVRGDSLQRLVLAAGPAEQQATSRVLQRYGISQPMHLTQ